jgi:hypothetical protein
LHLWWYSEGQSYCGGEYCSPECSGATTLRDAFLLLVERGRIDIVNGGFVQHDEALTSLYGAVNQLAVGNRWLDVVFARRQFVAAHIDPFGHSSATTALFLLAGYNASVLNRIDKFEKESRADAQLLEFWSRSSLVPSTNHAQQSLFVHIVYGWVFVFLLLYNSTLFCCS